MKKVIAASIVLPTFVFLAGSYFDRFVVKAEYNADRATNSSEHRAITEDLKEIKEDVKLILEVLIGKKFKK